MADSPKTPFHNPFAALAPLRREMGAPSPPPPAAEAHVSTSNRGLPGVARAVVRLQRSGRGGKEVTVIEHLGLRSSELDGWLKALKVGLGCGGSVEGDAIVLQGDQRPRLAKLLIDRGVKKIVMG